MELVIQFENTDSFFIDESLVLMCLSKIVSDNSLHLGDLSLVFCSDEYILDVNKSYLNHDYYTDIITFDYSDSVVVSGDLIISVDTVKSNSFQYGVSFQEELFRVVIHGCLHLCGFGDKTPDDEVRMRNMENHYLDVCPNPFVSRETYL